MKICEDIPVIGGDKAAWKPCARRAHSDLFKAIREVVWPPGAGSFSINPTPVLEPDSAGSPGLFSALKERGWDLDSPVHLGPEMRSRAFSAVKRGRGHTVAVQFLIGGRDALHKEVNDLAMGLIRGSERWIRRTSIRGN